MAVQKPTEADRRAFRSGFERAGVTAMKRWTTTLASNVTTIAPHSAGFNASAGWTHELAMQQFNDVLAYVYISLASATSIDIALQVANATGGPYHDFQRRTIAGGVATDVQDFDRFTTGGRKAIPYANIGGPYIRWIARRTGGSGTTLVTIGAQPTQEGGSH